jgi:hypothetical protein
MQWTPTAHVRPDDLTELMPDDWTLENEGVQLARIFKTSEDSQDVRWFWTVMILPDGKPGDGGAGYAPNVHEARRQCKVRVPEGFGVRTRKRATAGTSSPTTERDSASSVVSPSR